jgi:YVTN family beta-propeller protein
VVLIDLAGREKPKRIGLGGTAATVRFQSDSKQLLVANTADRLLIVLSMPSGKLVVQLPLVLQPERFCFKPDGGQLFITGAGMDAVAVVYPYRTEVAETVLAGRLPGAMAATTTTDYDYLFVSNTASGDVTILDITERKAIARVAAGREPDFITVTPDGQYALILNRQSGDMAVIHIPAITVNRYKAAALFTLIPVGSRPVAAAVKSV